MSDTESEMETNKINRLMEGRRLRERGNTLPTNAGQPSEERGT